MKMTVEDAVNIYSQKFGGFPWELVCCCSDEEIVKKAINAVETGNEITAEPDRIY